MIESIFGINWGVARNIFIALPIIICAAILLALRMRKTGRVIALLSSFNKQTIAHFSPFRNYAKAILFIMGVTFLAITLLHPQWDKKEETIAQEGRDLFIALDVSRSMLARDCVPNRLECAKAKIKELVRQLSSERVGLILFSGSALVQCPLTSDYGAFFMFLDQVDVETISSGSTAFDQAIVKVIEAFSSSQERKNKLAIFFTDGEDFSSSLAQVKQQVQKENLHIFTVGVGTSDGAPIPLFDEHGTPKGHQLDKKGSVVISRLNEGILSTLAQDSGGVYIRMTHDDADIKSLISLVLKFEKEKIEDKKVARVEEQYPYFLFVSFLCFALEWLL